MNVTPVKSLFNSELISDVIRTGGRFVVNMNTGMLTVHREVGEVVHHHQIRAYYKPDRFPSVRLSDDLDTALVQLKDQFSIGKDYGKIYWTAPNHKRLYEVISGYYDGAAQILRSAYYSYPELR